MSKETLEWLNQNTLIGYVIERGTAWHYDGESPNHYDGPVPHDDAVRLLDFNIASAPLLIERVGADGTTSTEPYLQRGKPLQAYYRPDNGAGLGIHSDGWQGHGYVEWLMANAGAIADSDLDIGSVVLLKDGAVASVSFEMPDSLVTFAGDKVRPSLLCATSYDGSLATTYKLVSTRVVCDNTQEIALSERSNRAKVKHTRNSRMRGDDIRSQLGIMHAQTENYLAEIERLCKVDVSDAAWNAFLDVHIPIPEAKVTKGDSEGRGRTMAFNKRDAFNALWKNDARIAGLQGTAYGALQVDNTWRLHTSTVRGQATRRQRNMSDLLAGKTLDADRLALANLDLAMASLV